MEWRGSLSLHTPMNTQIWTLRLQLEFNMEISFTIFSFHLIFSALLLSLTSPNVQRNMLVHGISNNCITNDIIMSTIRKASPIIMLHKVMERWKLSLGILFLNRLCSNLFFYSNLKVTSMVFASDSFVENFCHFVKNILKKEYPIKNSLFFFFVCPKKNSKHSTKITTICLQYERVLNNLC
jgi:hypothetical protein